MRRTRGGHRPRVVKAFNTVGPQAASTRSPTGGTRSWPAATILSIRVRAALGLPFTTDSDALGVTLRIEPLPPTAPVPAAVTALLPACVTTDRGRARPDGTSEQHVIGRGMRIV